MTKLDATSPIRPPQPPDPTFAEFAEHVRARARNLRPREALLSAALGLAGESGEVVDKLKKVLFHGALPTPAELKGLDPEAVMARLGELPPLTDEDRHHLLLELGDALFYLFWIARLLGFSMADVARANMEKLLHRYPQGFKPSR